MSVGLSRSVSCGVVPILAAALVLVAFCPDEAAARPKFQDKTLSLSATGFTYTSAVEKRCDSKGKDCEDTGTDKDWSLGFGGGIGYLVTDQIEIGVAGDLVRSSSKFEPEDEWDGYSHDMKSWDLSGLGYAKWHIGDHPRTVPYLAGGLGLVLTWAEDEWDYPYLFESSEPVKSAYAAFALFGELGVDYYIADMYAVSAFFRVMRTGRAWDRDTNDPDNSMTGEGEWYIRVGLGTSTYF